MSDSHLVLVDGVRRTRVALANWRRDPWPIVRAWGLGSLAVALVLLVATWAVAVTVQIDPDDFDAAAVNEPGTLADVWYLLGRNALVLALHGLACVAGFIARSSLPLQAERYSGWWRRMHDHIGSAALAFVFAATLVSLGTQALALGRITSAYAVAFDLSPAALLATRLLHALPELAALFLPLAAWLVTSRRGRWQDLLAATVVTVAVAVPVLVGAALIEVYVSPHLLPPVRLG